MDRPAVRPTLGTFGGLGVANDVAVHHHLDGVALVLVEMRRLGQIDQLAVHPRPDEALPRRRLEDPVAFGLPVVDQRPEDHQAGPLLEGEDLVHDLLDRLALDDMPVGTVRDADPGEEQAQVVVDLGHRADGRARVA